MSEFMNAQDDQKLIGPPPGYVGYENGGQLTNHVLRRPYMASLLGVTPRAGDPVLLNNDLTSSVARLLNRADVLIEAGSDKAFAMLADAAKHS